jgi:hypothetical protein
VGFFLGWASYQVWAGRGGADILGREGGADILGRGGCIRGVNLIISDNFQNCCGCIRNHNRQSSFANVLAVVLLVTWGPMPLRPLLLPHVLIDKHARCRLHPSNRPPRIVFLPCAHLWVTGFHHLAPELIRDDDILSPRGIGLAGAHQDLLLSQLDHAHGKQIGVQLHLSTISECQTTIVKGRLYLSLEVITFISGVRV